MTLEKLRNFEPLFGKWTIDGKISQGRNFNLFRVSRKTEAGTDYLAVKTIRFPENETEFQKAIASSAYMSEDDYLNSLEARLRLNMEKMMSLRQSENIVRFDDYMIIREIHCFYVVILTELLMPLSEYFSRNRTTQKDIAKLGADISSALCDFRGIGIILKAVRPDNIFVTPNGIYKLGDFGIDTDAERQEAKSFSDYYPPESQYASTFSNTLDIYSLGMTLYKFMNRNRMPFLPPFPSDISPEDRQRAFEKRLSGEEIPAPELSDETFSKIILKSISFTPERRYRAPEFLLNDLSRYLSGDTVEAVPPAPKEQFIEEETAEEISEFQNAFNDDAEEEGARDNKNRLYTIIGIAAAVLVCLAILVTSLGRRNASEEPTLPDITTTKPLITKQTEAETTTEEVTATEAETTTEETTTEAETTPEEITTTEEPTTLEVTTTEAPTTTAPETTTEIITTVTEAPTNPPSYTEEELILYRQTGNVAGELDSEGREFSELSGLSAKTETQGDSISRVVVTADNFGTNPYKNSDAFICQVVDGTVILKEAVSYTCSYDVNDEGGDFEIIINFAGDIYLDETSDFYIVFEDGAISSDEYTSLGTQIKI